MICPISDENRDKLKLFIVDKLEDLLDQKAPLSMQGLMASVYTEFGKEVDSDQALSFVQQAPTIIREMIRVDDAYLEQFASNLPEIIELQKKLDTSNPLKTVADYLTGVLGVPLRVVEKVQRQITAKKGYSTLPQDSQLEDPQAITSRIKEDIAFNAMPSDPNSTTGSEVDSRGVPYTDRIQRYAFIRHILKELTKPNITDSTDLPIIEGGIRLSAMLASRLGKYKPASIDANTVMMVVTDFKGNILTFNTNHELSEDGSPMFYGIRDIQITKKDGKTTISYSPPILSPVKVVEKRNKQGDPISLEEYKQVLREDSEFLLELKKYLQTNPTEVVMSVINGGSNGYIPYDEANVTLVQEIEFGTDPFVVQIQKAKTGPFYEGAAYFTVPGVSNPILLSRKPMGKDLVEKIASTLVDPIIDRNTSNEVYTVSNSDKLRLVLQYRANTELFSLGINEETGNIVVTMRGKATEITPDNKESIRKQIISFFTTPQAIPWSETVSAVNGDSPSFNINTLKQGTVVKYGTGPEARYYKYITPEFTINQDLLRDPQTFNNYSLEPVADGSYRIINRIGDTNGGMNYLKFIKANTFVKYKVSEGDRKLRQANAYFTFQVPEDQKRKVIPIANNISTPEVTVYQGYKTSLEDREFEYYAISQEEAKDYGPNVREVKIDTTGALDTVADKELYFKLKDEFKKQSGKTFDILDNSKEGLETQKQFFNFLKDRGYTGLNMLNQGDSRYFVAFAKEKEVTKPTTSAIDDFIRDIESGLFKTTLVKIEEVKATPEQIAKAKTWFDNSPLSEHIGFNELFNAINSEAVAEFLDGAITLYAGSDYSDLYHEAWHAFSQAFMTVDQKIKLYTEIGKLSGSFTTNNGKRVTFSKATYQELEEYLGEDFREYMLSDGKTYKGKERNTIFRKILMFLKALFGSTTVRQQLINERATNTIQELYEKLRVGNLTGYSFSAENILFGKLNKGIEAISSEEPIQSLSSKASLEARKAIDSIFSTFQDELNLKTGKQYTSHIFRTVKGRMTAYTRALDRLKERRQEILEDLGRTPNGLQEDNTVVLNAYIQSRYKVGTNVTYTDTKGELTEGQVTGYLINTENDKISHIRVGNTNVPIGEITDNKLRSGDKPIEEGLFNKAVKALEILNWIINNYGDPQDLKSYAEGAKGLIAYHNKKSEFLSYEDRGVEDAADNNVPERFKLAGNETSVYEQAKAEVLYMLRGLQKQKRVIKDGKVVYEPVYDNLGFPELIELTPIVNRLSKILNGSMDPEEMYQRLQNEISQTGNRFYYLNQLLTKLGPPTNPDPMAQDMWTAFWMTFNQYFINQPIVFMDYVNNQWTTKTGSSYGDMNTMKRMWNINFSMANTQSEFVYRPTKSSAAVLNLEGLRRKYPNEKAINEDKVGFLRDLGIPIDVEDPDIRAELYNKPEFKDFGRYMSPRIKLLIDAGIKIDKVTNFFSLPVSRKKGEKPNSENRLLNAIASVFVKYSDIYSDASLTTPEGDTRYALSLNSSSTAIAKGLNKATSLSQDVLSNYMSYLDYERNPWAKRSWSLYSMFDPNTGHTRRMSGTRFTSSYIVENVTGLSILKDGEFTGQGINAASADETAMLIMNIAYFVQHGIIPNPTPGEKSTRLSTRVSQYVYNEKTGKLSKTGKIWMDVEHFAAVNAPTLSTKIYYSILPYLLAESERIVIMKRAESSPQMFENNFDTYKKSGKKFQLFDQIISEKTKDKIYSLLEEEGFDLETYLESQTEDALELRGDISRDFMAYWNNEFQKTIDLYNKGGKISDDILEDLVKKSTSLSSKYRNFATNRASRIELEQSVLKALTFNTFIHNTEATIINYGDIAQYITDDKEEFHKRIQMFSSSGDIFRTDEIMMDVLNSMLTNGYAKSIGINFKGSLENGYFSNVLTSAIMDDPKMTSIYIKEIADGLRKDITTFWNKNRKDIEYLSKTQEQKKALIEEEVKKQTKAYMNMKVADAQGWITFDSYRLLAKAQNDWSPAQEALFQDIVNGKDVDIAKTIKYFPIRKYQYAGALATPYGLPAMAGHKFSLMPLIPNVIKGSPNLVALHEKMMRSNVDYVTLKSGSKITTITHAGKPDLFYKNNDLVKREFDNEQNEDGSYKNPFMPNKVYMEFLKKQQPTNSEFKESTIFATQLRKIIEEGLVEGGVPTDFMPEETDLNKRIAAWKKLGEADRMKSNKYRLYSSYEKALTVLTNKKKEKLLKSIGWGTPKTYGKVNKTLMEFLKKEMTRQDLSDHEISYLDIMYNGALKYKDLSLHLSQELIEKVILSIVNRNLIRQKINGEPLIQVSGLGWENMADWSPKYSLTNPTKEQLENFGTNGLTYYQYNTGPNGLTRAMTVKIALQGEFKKLLKHKHIDGKPIETLARLNEAIKNKQWLDTGDNRRLITMVGVRIPVQGLNSMEFMQVAEFLPENAGNMIVLPAEIVAKSGSDFDIDKLSIYMPNITVVRSKVEKGTVKTIIPQNKVSGVPSYGSTVVANDETIKKLGDKATSIDMIAAGLRTRTTRSAKELKKYKISVGDIVAHKGISANGKEKMVYTRITAIHPKGSSEWVSTWEKEGWRNEDISVINRYNDGAAAIEFELLEQEVGLEVGDTEGAAENHLMGTMIDILSYKDNYASLVRPNDTYTLDPIVNDPATGIRDFVTDYNPKDAPDGTKLSKISGSDLVQFRYNLYVHVVNKVAQEALGIAAVDNTFNILFNRVGAYMNFVYRDGTSKELQLPKGGINKRITLFMDHNTLVDENDNEVISLSHMFDAKGVNKISDNISQAINLLLEIAKNDSAFYLQLNKETIPTLLFLNQAGVPIKQAVYFSAHPIIREYLDEIRKARTPVSDVLGTTANSDRNFFQVTARARIMEKYGLIADSNKEMLENSYKMYMGEHRNPKSKEAHRNIYSTMMRLAVNEDGSLTDTAKSAFNPDNLLRDIKTYQPGKSKEILSEEERLILLHWFHIEDFSRPVKDIKLRLNFDTSRTKSAFMSANKKATIEALASDGRIPYKVVSNILEFSPISSLYMVESNGNTFIMDLIKPLLPLRGNDKITSFLNSILANYGTKKEIEELFGDVDKFVNLFINDLVMNVFQEKLRSFDIKGITEYRNTVVKEGVSVKKIPYLKFGAYVQDNVMYIDTKQLIKDFQEGNYLIPGTTKIVSGDSYVNRGLAPIGFKQQGKQGQPSSVRDVFSTVGEYFNFVLEREYIRSYTKLSDITSDSHFQKLRKVNINDLVKHKDEAPEAFTQRVDRLSYEEWIRDRALDNIGNGWKLFFSDETYAQQFEDMLRKHKLREQEPMLENIVVEQKEIKSLSTNDTQGALKNLRLLNYSLTGEQIDAYHKLFSDYANPGIRKVDGNGNYLSDAENQKLSELFARLPLVAFLQSGLTTTGPYSLVRLVPAEKIMDFMGDAVEEYTKKLDIERLKSYHSRFIAVNGNYVLSKRYKNYTKEQIPMLSKRDKFTAAYGLVTPKDGVAVYGLGPFYGLYDTSKLNLNSAKNTGLALPDRVFVYDAATIETNPGIGSSGYFAPEKSKLTNVVGIPTKLRYGSKESDMLTDNTLKDNMLAIEKAIQQLKTEARVKKLTFSDAGYGQGLIGLKEDGVTPISKEGIIPAPMTFMYLSQRLYEEFNYVNPNYDGLTMPVSPPAEVKERDNITGVDLTTYLSEKKTSLGKWKKDSEVMNNSQAAIAYPLKPITAYESSSVAYARALNEKGYKTGIQDFTGVRSVWIFGNLAGYGGISRDMLKTHFEGMYKPRIDDAIAAGVTIFNIADGKSGIDVMAAEYLKTLGFNPTKHEQWTSYTREAEKVVGELTFSPEMLTKIKSGSKTAMSGNVDLTPGLYKLPDGSIVRVGTPVVYPSIREVTKAYGTAEKWAKEEGFSSFSDVKKNTQSEFLKQFLKGAAKDMRTYPISLVTQDLSERQKTIEEANLKKRPAASSVPEEPLLVIENEDIYQEFNSYEDLLSAYENDEIAPELIGAAYQELRSANLLKYLNYNPNQLSLTFPSESVINGEILTSSQVLASKSVVNDSEVMDQIMRCITG